MGKSKEPCFNYAKLHCIDCVTQEHIKLMESGGLNMYIFGLPEFKPRARKDGLMNFGRPFNYWLPATQLDLFGNRLYLITAAHVVLF